jgi:hypothetical protein
MVRGVTFEDHLLGGDRLLAEGERDLYQRGRNVPGRCPGRHRLTLASYGNPRTVVVVRLGVMLLVGRGSVVVVRNGNSGGKSVVGMGERIVDGGAMVTGGAT